MATDEEAMLREAIKKLIPKIAEYRRNNISEAQTKSAMVEPILRALGWDTGYLEEVKLEYRAKPDDNPVDYALLVRGRVKLLIEAKRLGEDLRKGRVQLLGNACINGVAWGIQTDGDKYRVFKADGAGDASEKIFFEIWISGQKDDIGLVVNRLSLLSRSNMASNPARIDSEWTDYRINNRVKTALQTMLNPSDPMDREHKGLISLICQKCPELKPEAVTASLLRLEVSRGEVNFVAPPVDPPPDTATSGGSGRTDPKPNNRNAMQTFIDLLGDGKSMFKDDVTAKLIEAGLAPGSAQSYLVWAKRDPTNKIPAKGGNPFGFQIREFKDSQGRKVLLKLVKP